jgi:hypothetical protein
MAFSITQWTPAQFAGAKDAWNELRRRSGADPLFMSWEWQYTWWKTFSEAASLDLFILAAYDEEGRLCGIAPLLRRRSTIRGLLTVTRVELIGNLWRGPTTMRTQHVDFIIQPHREEEISAAFLRYLSNCDWDEAALSDLKADSSLLRALQRNASAGDNNYARFTPSAVSYYVDTTGSFDDYLAARGKNTRLQMYNRRKNLERLGKVELQQHCGDHEQFFTQLNHLHALRWGKDAFAGRRLEFNRQVAMLMEEEKGTHFSTLLLDGKPLSVLYNYRTDGQEYYIQGGFREDFDKKVALGFLHLGYAIEDAFADPAIKRFNLLPGGGKSTSYKPRITANYDAMTETQVVKGRLLKLAYRAYDALRRKNEVLAPELQPVD